MNWHESKWFAEWLRLARLVLVLVSPLSVRAVDIYAVHTNGTTTPYTAASNTDLARGAALLAAVTNGIAGDRLYLTNVVFDLGATNRLQLQSVQPGMSLIGAGRNATEIKTQCDFSIVGNAFIQVGTNSLVSDLTVTSRAGSNKFSFPVGVWHGPAATGVALSNLNVSGNSDCIYMFTTNASSASFYNLNLSANYDCYNVGSTGGTYYLTNCVSVSTATSASGFAEHGFGATLDDGTFTIVDSTFTGTGGTTDNNGILLNGGTVSITRGAATAIGANACDLNIGSGSINASGLRYSTTCGLAPVNLPATYYVDWDTGSDANLGTSTTTPWKRAPGMNGFAATYHHVAGDQYMFKGGVRWPNSAFQLKITRGGAPGTPDVFGSDANWFTGPFWTPPIWDFENIALGTGFNSGAGVLLDAAGGAFGYVTFSFLDVQRHRGYLAPNDFGACTFTLSQAPHHVLWANCTIRDWSIPTPAAGQDGTGGGGICMVAGGGAGCRVTGCVLTQAGATNGCRSGRALSLFGTIDNTTIYQTPNAFLGSGSIHDCDVHDIVGATDPNAHENGIYTQAPSQIFNNRVYNIVSSGSAIYTSPSFSGGTGFDSIYNNLVYNTGAQGPLQIDTDGATPQLCGSHVYNNTLVANGGYCIRVVARGTATLGLLDMVNNQLITSGGTAICYNNTGAGCANVGTVTNLTPLVQTPTVASAAGYTAGNSYQPTLISSPTVGAGTDLSMLFTTSLLGVTRIPPWDIGCYQFSATPPPHAPASVRILAEQLKTGFIRTKP